MQLSWFRKMLLSYFPIFLVTITVIVFLSFLMVNEISRKGTAKADEISTRFIMESMERSVNGIEMNVMKEMETNTGYTAYLNRTSDEQKLIYALAPDLREMTDGDELIESIYLYRESDQTILTSRGKSELSVFPDRAFIESALQHPDYRGWSAIRNMPEVGSSTPTRVISMYKRLPLPFGSQGMLVINVDMYQMEQIVNAMTDGSVSYLIVKDAEGSFIHEVHESENSAADRKVLTTLYSEQLGWEFESGIMAGQLYEWVSVISYVWIVIGVFTVLFAIIYIVYITRKNYRPIQLMMSRIQSIQQRNEAPLSASDELAMIDNALESLISRSQDYEKQHHENLLLQRSRLFLDLIGGHKDNGDLAGRMRELSPLPPLSDTECYAIVLAEINEYARFQSFYSTGDQHVLKFALMNVFQELARNERLHSWAEWISDRRVAILIVLPECNGDVGQEKLREIADECRSWVEEKLRLSVSFGIGQPVRGLDDIQQSLAAASEALQHKLSFGTGTIMFGDGMNTGDWSTALPYLGTIAELVKELRQNNDEWKVRLQEMFTGFKKDLLKDESIRSLLQTLLQMLSAELGVYSEELKKQLAGEQAENWQAVLKESRTLDELQERIGEALTEVYRNYVVVTKTKSHRAMINEMKSYIEENFSDPDLSLKHLSDRFQISGKYASYLFKLEFDMKFVDFLVHLRMERAEKLLRETKQPIQDIALSIGYANSITFGRVFKRTFGLAPGDYRKLKLRSSSAISEGL